MLPEPIRRLFAQTGTLRSRELEAYGIRRIQLSRWAAAGELNRLGRGLYALPDYAPNEHASLVEVARRAPHVVFCLLTALRFHELTTQAPYEVWIAIGNKEHPPRLLYPKLRVLRFSPESLHYGVEEHSVDGAMLKVTSMAKTVADCFKFRNKIGLDVAIEARREAVKRRRVSADEIWRAAKVCRVAAVMRPYLDSIE
ncbi:type IV toxin-antitoxin system AbiEi family antitoxin domain-containing protein [Dokdonella immobilis]|uniref:Transcriptional regulator, AbiEi antitoxin, Type IV TA system n=1 Tax=Dokdonella immobilis TaxID=578942 RepID=A0A1I4ZCN2_9GAMM|nr:type IV toxin-antitoxin system AbiEi family antitoxin domain-containing protein [Dokdonella immobilis]SFN47783.1 Transcriptional regulator, AbiEi antitoxin, Type IV TA system [Dokdonella immobilis]